MAYICGNNLAPFVTIDPTSQVQARRSVHVVGRDFEMVDRGSETC